MTEINQKREIIQIGFLAPNLKCLTIYVGNNGWRHNITEIFKRNDSLINLKGNLELIKDNWRNSLIK